VVVVAAGGDEGGFGTKTLGQLEAEHAAVKLQRAFEFGDFEMHVADANPGMDRTVVGHGMSVKQGGMRVKVADGGEEKGRCGSCQRRWRP
jgi:hypothetical protein